MKAEIITNYQCPECHELHDCKSSARSCCVITIDEVYTCSVCKKEMYQRWAADEHLTKPHDETKMLDTKKIYAEMLVFSNLHPVDAMRAVESIGTETEPYTEPIFTRINEL